jgi:hypothetical protein
MNKEEAGQVLESIIRELRAKSRSELEQLLDNPEVSTVDGKSGAIYQIEREAVWDDKKGQDLRVMVLIDDGGWRAFSPMSDSFIMAPDGSFVGE